MMNSRTGKKADPGASLINFRWSVDHSVMGDSGAALVFGWAIHDTQPIRALRILLHYHDGSQQRLEATYGTERADIARRIGDNPRASTCGYYFFGQIRHKDVTALSLETLLANGECVTLPTNSSITVPSHDLARGHIGGRVASYGRLAKRTLQLLLSGRFFSLLTAARRFLRDRPQKAAGSIFGARGMMHEAGPAQLVVDHDMGGGANQFRHALVKRLLEEGNVVLILTFHVPTLQYVLEYRRKKEVMRSAIDFEELLQTLPDLKLHRVHWNNAVSFTRQIELLDALTSLAQGLAVPVTYYLHDYHSVCPVHFLLDQHGKYCGVPNISKCTECLPAVKDGLASLFADRDIHLWRRRWEALLLAADEIVYFSHASLALLIRAYPQLARHAGLRYRPHDVTDFAASPLAVDLRKPMNIGIVGHISVHKGAHVVRQLVDAVEKGGLDVRVTVLGDLEGAENSPALTVTGKYKRDELAALLRKRKVNVIAFPSIVPETFSYVVSEVMSLRLPLVCFDLGAPAERVRNYRFGRVIALGDGKSLLEAAMTLRHDLLRSEAAQKHGIRPPPTAGTGPLLLGKQ